MTTAPTRGRVERARQAVAVAFVLNGFAFASWVSRLPDLRDRLGLDPGGIGLLLLALSAGTLVALPTSGWVISRLGAPRTVLLGVVLVAVGQLTGAVGLTVTSVPLVAVALFVYGVGTSSWDVAMNVEAVDVERRLGRVLMPRFHAGFSIGTVLGALTGAASSAAGVTLAVHLVGAMLLVLATGGAAVRLLLPATPVLTSDRVSPWRAWREPRTLAIGLLVMAFALCEGIANDWLALAMVDGYEVSPAAGSAAFAVFVTAMTAGRLSGGWVIDRLGRVGTLRVTGGLVIAGVGAVVLSPGALGGYLGALLWGAGASLGFPMGMTAAGEDEKHAAVRLSVVTSIGYAAFLGGPPLVGGLADQVGVRDSLWVAVGAALVGIALARTVAPPQPPR